MTHTFQLEGFGESALGRAVPSLGTLKKHFLNQADIGHRHEWPACCTQEALEVLLQKRVSADLSILISEESLPLKSDPQILIVGTVATLSALNKLSPTPGPWQYMQLPCTLGNRPLLRNGTWILVFLKSVLS